MFTFDDVAGYHHVEIIEEFRKYLGFEWEGVYYEGQVCHSVPVLEFL